MVVGAEGHWATTTQIDINSNAKSVALIKEVLDKSALRACFAIDAISSADCKDADCTAADCTDIA